MFPEQRDARSDAGTVPEILGQLIFFMYHIQGVSVHEWCEVYSVVPV